MASANPSNLSNKLSNELLKELSNEQFNPDDFLMNKGNNTPQQIHPSVPSQNKVDIFAKDNPQLFIKYYIDEYNPKTQNKSKIILLLIDATKYLDFLVSKEDIRHSKIHNLKDDNF
jgi:hypothetical protein